jgi:hypothetical protein
VQLCQLFTISSTIITACLLLALYPCRSQALLPLFNASSGYLHDKISSSVLASLAAGVPLMVPRRFLEVYEAFKEEHVLLLVRSTVWVWPGCECLSACGVVCLAARAATREGTGVHGNCSACLLLRDAVSLGKRSGAAGGESEAPLGAPSVL